jgi:predicted DNA-binding transcriptional regulator AlpA
MDTIHQSILGRAPARGPSSIDPEDLIDSISTAKLLRLQPQTLATWRAERRGPRYVKIGRACFYVRADIERWIAEQLRDPNCEAA